MTGFCEWFVSTRVLFLAVVFTFFTAYSLLKLMFKAYDCLGDSELLAQGGKDGEEAGLSV